MKLCTFLLCLSFLFASFANASATLVEGEILVPYPVKRLAPAQPMTATTATDTLPPAHVPMPAAALSSAPPQPSIKTNSPTSEYTIRPGDLLQVTVWKEEELDREVTVLPDGMADFPLIGSFKAAGMTTATLQDSLRQQLAPYIPAAAVTVVVKETRGNSVSIIGQVTRPGDIIMTRSTTVMQALSQAGGLSPYASEEIVILRKIGGKETSIDFDYSDVSAGRNLETNITLQPGDVIVVPTASLF